MKLSSSCLQLATTVFLVFFCTVPSSYAQSVTCGFPYAAVDRSDLRGYLVDDLRFMGLLSRLQALATLSESGDFTAPQRMALDSEYQAIITAITTMGDWTVPGYRPRTNAWLHRIVDSNFLGLTGTDVLTPASATAALWATVTASRRFYLCY